MGNESVPPHMAVLYSRKQNLIGLSDIFRKRAPPRPCPHPCPPSGCDLDQLQVSSRSPDWQFRRYAARQLKAARPRRSATKIDQFGASSSVFRPVRPRRDAAARSDPGRPRHADRGAGRAARRRRAACQAAGYALYQAGGGSPLVVDVMPPAERLACRRQDFQADFPTVALRLRISGLRAVGQLVLAASRPSASTARSGRAARCWNSGRIGDVELVPVAAPDHPLAPGAGPLRRRVARSHPARSPSDRSPLTAGQDFGVLAERTWRIADLSAKHALPRAGIGWSSMPR